MKTRNIYKLFIAIGCALAGLYPIMLCYKYFIDQSWRWGSLSFHNLARIYAIMFLIPAAIMFVIAIALKRRAKKQHLG